MEQKSVEKDFKNPRPRKSAVRLDLSSMIGKLDPWKPNKTATQKELNNPISSHIPRDEGNLGDQIARGRVRGK